MKEAGARSGTPRLLRKQLLLMRAATERAEMVGALHATRHSATFFNSGASGLLLARGMPLALGLLKRTSWVGPVLSLMLSGARRPLLRYALLGAGSALLVWKTYQWFAGRPEQSGEQSGDRPEPLS